MTTLSLSRRITATAFAALALGGVTLASTSSAEAGWRHGYYGGGAVAAGVVGGLALGALAASAARPRYDYGYYPAYAPGPAYGECYVVRRRVMTDYGWRRVRQTVCD